MREMRLSNFHFLVSLAYSFSLLLLSLIRSPRNAWTQYPNAETFGSLVWPLIDCHGHVVTSETMKSFCQIFNAELKREDFARVSLLMTEIRLRQRQCWWPEDTCHMDTQEVSDLSLLLCWQRRIPGRSVA